MRTTRRILACAAVAVLFALSGGSQDVPSYTPKEGFVPDSATAIKIAEAVLIPVYGERLVISEQPFSANLKNGVWDVVGTLNCPVKQCMGGVAYVRIAKSDARILYMEHGK